MKHRPIPFTGEMVRAILAGRKSQTRRLVKPIRMHADHGKPVWDRAWNDPSHAPNPCLKVTFDGCGHKDMETTHRHFCPFGSPGDRLWVKEKWRPAFHHDLYCTVQYAADSSYRKPDFDDEDRGLRFADMCDVSGDNAEPWHSPMFMWREMSRITLEVTGVRVERLQDISEADCAAEGMTTDLCADILAKAAGVEPEDSYYVRYANGSEFDGHHCLRCCEKEAKKRKGSCIVAEHCPETDGPAYCEECYVPLQVSLTEYGIDRELFLEDDSAESVPHFAATGMDAAIAAQFAGGIGDLQDHHRPRLNKIGYATLWDSINGKGSWDANPWVWVIEFRRLP